MPRRLIRLLPEGRHAWFDGAVEHAGLPSPGEAAITLLVPGEEVLLLDIARPPGAERQWPQLLPYAIEDQVIAPIESQHVAWAPASTPSRLRVAVVARARLDAWLAPLRAAGLEPDRVIPDVLALPWHPGRTSLLVERGRLAWRLGECRALCGGVEELEALRDAAGAAATTRFQVGDAPLPAIAGETKALASAWAAFDTLDGPALNLLQGDYAPRGRAGDTRRAWRWAAAFAGAAVLLPVLQAGIENQRLTRPLAQPEMEIPQFAQAHAPAAAPGPAAPRHLAAPPRAARDPRGLALLARAAPVLAASNVQVQSLESSGTQLDLVVSADDLAGLDALRERLRQAGLDAELDGTTPGTPGVQGRLRLGTTR